MYEFFQVPLGVQLKNEMYLTDMCSVLDSFNACVATNGRINKVHRSCWGPLFL